MELDKQFLPQCSAVLRLPGESAGADAEVEFAMALNIPVFDNIEMMQQFFVRLSEVEGSADV